MKQENTVLENNNEVLDILGLLEETKNATTPVEENKGEVAQQQVIETTPVTPIEENQNLPKAEVTNIEVIVEPKAEPKKKRERKVGDKPNKEKTPSKNVILSMYKTVDNLIAHSEVMKTIFPNCRLETETQNETIYSTSLNALELLDLWKEKRLVYDPSMQRGLKEDKEGRERAVFKETHIRKLAEDMLQGNFTNYTQIIFGLINDDPDTKVYYEEDTQELEFVGKIRLADGQHRVKAVQYIMSQIEAGKIEDTNGMITELLESIVFNVAMHHTSSVVMTKIYSNTDKGQSLTKAQTAQLSTEWSSKITNFLNRDENSSLKGLISVQRPLQNKLVLFNVVADAVKKYFAVSNKIKAEEVQNYLIDFFNYVSYKFEAGFGDNENARRKFKEENILNENMTFDGWIKLASECTLENYKEMIDHVVNNVDFFKKTNEYWLKEQVVKYGKEKDGKTSMAMANSTTSLKAITDTLLNVATNNGYVEEVEVPQVNNENENIESKEVALDNNENKEVENHEEQTIEGEVQ